jgi:hypothetical protein
MRREISPQSCNRSLEALRFGNLLAQHRHCEERSDEAIQLSCRGKGSWIASLS